LQFNGRAFEGFTFDDDHFDYDNHGTHCAGIVADIARYATIISVKVQVAFV
jgi:subtilisin family serine protease